ncbi:MAG: dihydroorotate dehydrogenase, partial [Zetaproteobacteria bacterium]
MRPDLSVEFAGLRLRTPVVLLSGCVGFGDEYTRVEGFDWNDIGAVILKGTTLKPRLGNPPHRLAETPMGLLNAIGLQNPGARAVVEEILPRLPLEATHFWANVNGSTIEEYAEVTAIFDDSPVSAMEINISCPNVKAGGVHFGTDAKMAHAVVAAARARTSKPLIVKLSPNVTRIAEIAEAVLEAGADALSAINTMPGMAVDIEARRPVL